MVEKKHNSKQDHSVLGIFKRVTVNKVTEFEGHEWENAAASFRQRLWNLAESQCSNLTEMSMVAGEYEALIAQTMRDPQIPEGFKREVKKQESRPRPPERINREFTDQDEAFNREAWTIMNRRLSGKLTAAQFFLEMKYAAQRCGVSDLIDWNEMVDPKGAGPMNEVLASIAKEQDDTQRSD